MYVLLYVFILFILLGISFIPKENFENPGSSEPVKDISDSKSISSTIGKYDFLEPIPQPNTWNQDIINKFVDKYNSNLGSDNKNALLNASTFTQDKQSSQIYAFALEKEAVYYINNGRWPMNQYVYNYLNSNIIPKNTKLYNGSFIINNETVSQVYPNRLIYNVYIAPKEGILKPLPESYKIFIGEKPTPSPSQTSSSLSNADFQQLQSICKNISYEPY